MHNLDIENLPLPEKSDCGKVIIAGGFTIQRSYVVQKKIGKLTSLKVLEIFKVCYISIFTLYNLYYNTSLN